MRRPQAEVVLSATAAVTVEVMAAAAVAAAAATSVAEMVEVGMVVAKEAMEAAVMAVVKAAAVMVVAMAAAVMAVAMVEAARGRERLQQRRRAPLWLQH